MPLVGAVLGFDIDLPARLRAVFGVIKGAIDAILLDRVLRDLQARLRFLSLLLNASGIHAINLKVVVVAGTAGKTNGALVAATVVLSERSEKGKAGPIAAVIRKVCDLVAGDDRGGFSRGAILRRGAGLHFYFFCWRSDRQSRVQSSRLPDLKNDAFDYLCLKAGTGNGHRVVAYLETGKSVVAFGIGGLLFCEPGVGGYNPYGCASDRSAGLIGYRPFKHRKIDLRERHGLKKQNHNQAAGELQTVTRWDTEMSWLHCDCSSNRNDEASLPEFNDPFSGAGFASQWESVFFKNREF